jgi:xanthine dehydrogenase accessory factor
MKMSHHADILDLAGELKSKREPFVLATVVRTVAATAAKAGAKAIISAGGEISEGWIGGGCARAAVLRAAREALADGNPRLVSVQPQDLLEAQGVAPGEAREGTLFAKNMCPSRGTMDVFVEPVLPRPQTVVCGSSPVAIALADLARRMGFFVTVCAPAAEHALFGEVDRRVDGYSLPVDGAEQTYVVVATQGRSDLAALSAALAGAHRYVAFVGSRRKAASLRAKLGEGDLDAARIAAFKAPAGLDIGAITPDEIALSIVAEMVEVRRHGQRRQEGSAA